MELEIRGRNIEITEEVESYILKKMERLVRHLGNITEGKVELTKTPTRSQQDRIVAQVTLNVKGTLLRAQERGPTIPSAVDSIVDVMDRQIKRYKGKLYKGELSKKSGKGASIRYAETTSEEKGEPEEAPPGPGKVIRVKCFPMSPMTIDDAIAQMELLGHSFFLFLNSASKEYNVLYRRHDGDYGVIEPELL